MAKNKNSFMLPKYRINDELHGDYEVRIIGDGIESRVLTLTEAKKVAQSMNLDLIEINRMSHPPILRIASYEKLMYDLKKSLKKNKAAKPPKEIQLSANISEHDLDTKINHAKKFIEGGSKVKVILTLKGREMARRNENKRSILEFITKMEGIAVPEAMVRDEGNRSVVILKKKG